jgi:NTP pyrophosphatase (non-canonical NTP hydrolase)
MTKKEFKVGSIYSDKHGNKWEIVSDDGVGIFSLEAQCLVDVNDCGLDYEEFQPDGSYTLEEKSDRDLIWQDQSDYALTEFKRKIDLFNCIAGKSGVPSDQDIVNQVKLITEEAKEIKDALEQGEPEINLLQESLDVLVVTFGLLQMLKNKGYDVDKAMGRVVDTNLSKFTHSGVIAAESVSKYKENNEQVEFSYSSENDVWVLKDTNNKIRKPLNFKKVNLEDCKPEV